MENIPQIDLDLFNLSDKETNYSLFGLMLGDGWLVGRTVPNCKRFHLGIEHSMKQVDYMKWLEHLSKRWGIYQRSSYGRTKQTTYGPLHMCQLVMKLPDDRHFIKFNRFHNNDGKKIISQYVMQRITPLGLLFWFLDDGNLVVQRRKSESLNPKYDGYKWSRWATVSTYSFDKQSHEIAQKYLKERFDIDVSIRVWNPKSKPNSYLKLYINATNFRKLYDIVRDYLPYIPDDMRYKFDMKYSATRETEIDYQAYNLPAAHDDLTLIKEKAEDIVRAT